MAKKEESGETPSADLLTTLQNRINDLEADLKTQKDAASAAPKFERKEFDEAIALLKLELAEVKREKAAVKKVEAVLETEDDVEPIKNDWEEFAAGCRSLSAFED